MAHNTAVLCSVSSYSEVKHKVIYCAQVYEVTTNSFFLSLTIANCLKVG